MTTTAATTTALDRGVRIDAVGLTVEHRNGTTALDDVTLTVEPGLLTAVIGPSGAGKSTLLAALAGVAPAQRGTVGYDAADETRLDAGVGFVPQDDILHSELSLRRTLRYAASLRIAAPRTDVDEAVDHAMRTLGLAQHADVSVGSLSGGQRKRASIACEILTRPGVCFLDEPTSGLDPSTAADLVSYLRRMSADGSTVVFTTHSVEDIARSDRVVVLAPGGRLVALGTPAEVLERFGTDNFIDLYNRMASDGSGPRPVRRGAGVAAAPPSPRRRFRADRPGAPSQWWVLTRRAAEILARNRLTLAILLGSPAAVITMFAILFRPGSFSAGAGGTGDAGNTAAAVQISYWLSFAGFFFGLTFGLLQVCTEVAVLRMEQHAGVRTGAYVASKLALLAPILLLVNAAMIAVLRSLDRIPALSAGALAQLYLTMALNTVAALCLGLCTSALVNSTAQAALALPMLCFPAVLFSGAMVPLPIMTGTGHVIAAAMPDRWAFEAIARHLDVAAITAPSSPYATLGASSPATYWTLLVAFAAILGAGTYAAVRRRAHG
ncbi:MAG TPA: ATP-binding cassette domain-containing protein [Jatrophihabitans sp.]|jgi:ABC-type multidrug transport system ATPase subunit